MRSCAPAILAVVFVSAAWSSGCGSSAAPGDSDAGMDSGTGGSSFHVDISLTTGLITFPNNYTGWAVGGGSATNYVAYPSGWSVGGGSATNFIALPPGWTAGGGSATNYTALPPGWSTGGGSATNYIALPPGWATGGGSATNFVGYPTGQGWTVGGGSATNFTALPPGWSAGGGSATNFVAVPPGWVVGGGSSTNFITYPGSGVTTIQVKFDDPGWLGLLKALQDSGGYTESALADAVMYAFLNLRVANHLVEAPAGQW